jgi:hypothetical protein
MVVVDLREMQRWVEATSLFHDVAGDRPRFTAWGRCLMANGADARLSMSITYDGQAVGENLVVRFALEGVSLGEIERCGRAASFPVVMAPDGKALTLTMNEPGSPEVTQQYLAVPGGVFCRMSSREGMKPGENTSVRADLEQDVAAAGRASAATDPRLAQMVRKVDAKKPIWFVGHAGDLTDKLGAIAGTIALDRGVTVELTATFGDVATAKRRQAELQSLRASVTAGLRAANPGLAELMKRVAIQRKGADLLIRVAADQKQLQLWRSVLDGAAPADAGGRSIPAVRRAVPERFTMDQVVGAFTAMRECNERSDEPGNFFTCSCQQDLAMSPTFKPADARAHCADYTRRALAQIARSEEEQKRAPFLLASPEVTPPTNMLFAFALPCMIKAMKARSMELGTACMCRTHAWVNRIAMRAPLGTNYDASVVIQEAVSEVVAENLCEVKAP